MQSVIITTDGLQKKVDPANGKDFSLEELNEIVNGYIEILHIGDKLLVCNEEGETPKSSIQCHCNVSYQRSRHKRLYSR